MKCEACSLAIASADTLKCYLCTKGYHYQCVNMTSAKYRELDKKKWQCPGCDNITKRYNNSNNRGRNDDTPTRKQFDQPIPVMGAMELAPGASYSEDKMSELIRIEITKSLKAELPCILKEALARELAPFREQLSALSTSVEFMAAQYDEMKGKLDSREKDITNLLSVNDKLRLDVADLSTRLASLEQYSREANLELQGLPENKAEDLPQSILKIGKSLNITLEDKDILACFRVAKLDKDSQRPRTVIAKLGSSRSRDALLTAASKYNRDNPEQKLNTSHAGIAGVPIPIYLNEHLTPEKKALHAAARKKGKKLSFRFVWVKNGKIYMKKEEKDQAHVIHNMDVLNQLA